MLYNVNISNFWFSFIENIISKLVEISMSINFIEENKNEFR